MSNTSIISFDEFTREQLIQSLKKYALKELELDLGNFPAQFLFDFIVEEFGPHFYNQALNDAHEWLAERFTYLNDDLFILTKEKAKKKAR
ncbi:DUF2164 domain-containing protein [Acinetobacter sp.]|jgi:uncharacterized protein (DUF2164 family)|uniref:DUF2164 domain-containing protein n=1 Tax=Acinetobacter sp. TaxID=472 RepID=UPI00281749F6|nr:DUF2164 domain-containing protein [Acinetobacter sp.]MDR0238536.1 DUF2164 domain-containing protein [Acinetobacter sp.]